MTPKMLARVATIALLATGSAPAGVIVVDAAGGGDFTTLTAAVAAAVDGDLLLVRDGTYAEPAPVVIDGKALTITGEPQAFSQQTGVQSGFIVRNLPPTENVLLVNLHIWGNPGSATQAATPALTLQNNVSHVRIQSCFLSGGGGSHNANPNGAPAVDIAASASSAFVGSFLSGGSGKFSPSLSEVTGNGGPGIRLAAGQVLLEHAGVEGGTGGSNLIGGWPQGGIGGTGFRHLSGSIFIVASSLRGGEGGTAHNGGAGGVGLQMGASGLAWMMGGSFSQGGNGGFSDEGPNGAKGAALVDPNGLVTDFGGGSPFGTLHDFDLTSPIRENQSGTLKFSGHVGDARFLLVAPTLHQLPFPEYQGVLMLMPTQLLGPFPLGSPGNQSVPFVTPTLPIGIEFLQLHVQAAYAGAHAPVLGPARVLTILDASF
jgi:hypothetical protein